jgi:tRNA U54 and U55 pseudouridine synthase Pus10
MAENRFDDLFADADAAFNGRYKKELNQLMGLSKEDIDAITPETTDLKIYAVLVKVVEKASKDNLSQAQLVENIKSMGDVAVQIAKKVPGLAAWL